MLQGHRSDLCVADNAATVLTFKTAADTNSHCQSKILSLSPLRGRKNPKRFLSLCFALGKTHTSFLSKFDAKRSI